MDLGGRGADLFFLLIQYNRGKDRTISSRNNKTLKGSSARWAYFFRSSSCGGKRIIGKDPIDLPWSPLQALFKRDWGVKRLPLPFLVWSSLLALFRSWEDGRSSKLMNINEPSLMDVAHDIINLTQGLVLLEVAY